MRQLILFALLAVSPAWGQSGPIPLSSLPTLNTVPPSATILLSVTGTDGRPTFARVTPSATQAGLIPSSQLSQPNGPAQLDGGGKVPTAQLPLGSAVGQALGPLISWDGSGIPGYQVNLGLILGRPTTHGNDAADLSVQRDANYVGGTNGFVNAALRAFTVARAGTRSYENASLSLLENYSTAADNAQNVAAIAHTNVRGTGNSWAGISELDDYGAPDPTTARVAHEFDLFSNGTDANHNRVIVDAVGAKLASGGAIAQTGWGFRIQNSLEGASGSYFETGYGAGAAGYPVPVRILVDGLYAVAPTGTSEPVTALRMAAGQRIDWTGDHTKVLTYNPAGALQYQVSGSTVMQVGDLGQVLTSQLQLSPDAKATFQYNGSNGRLEYYYNAVKLFSVDQSGNAIFKGTVTQSGTP